MKLKRFLTGVLSAVMALSVCALPAAAAEGDASTTTTKTSTSTIDTGKKGSITIHKYVMVDTTQATTSNNGEEVGTDKIPTGATAASGAKFTLYKVMTKDDLIAYYNNGAETTPKAENYLSRDGKVDTTKVKNFDDAKKKDEKCVVEMPATDTNGVSTISDLELGLYLAVETTTPAAVTSAIQPFLISVPMTKVDTAKDDSKSADSWLYDIHVYPKNSTAVGEITLKKLGVIGNDTEHGEGLAGVRFKLERLIDGKENAMEVDSNWKQIESNETDKYFTTGLDGTVTISNLKPGTYRFTEIGYADKSENKFIINKDAQYVFVVTTNTDGKTVTVSQPETPPENKDDYKAESSQVTVYNYAPDVDKDVKDRVKGEYQQGADYAVGDTIEYKVKVVIPANIGKLKNFFLTDTPTNLTDKTDSIKFYSNAECTTEIASTDILVGTNGIAAYETDGFKITFDTTKLNDKLYAGKTIYIKYNAELKKEAAVTTTEGNHNTIDLTYSKKTSTDNTGAGTETEADWNKIEDTAVVYTFQIDITKTGENNETLDGVEFDLYEEVTKNERDTTLLTDAEAKALGFTNTSVSYKRVDHDVTAGGGKLTFKGLSNSSTKVTGGTNRYWLVETKTVGGYNLLAKPVEAKLSIAYMTKWTEKNKYEKGKLVKHERTEVKETFDPNENDNANNANITMNGGTEKGEDGTGSKSIVVVNKKGFTLPVTGGFGTLLFSGIGVLLVLAGVAVLFSMKKKNDRA